MTDESLFLDEATSRAARMNGGRPPGRLRQATARVTGAIDNANEASKRLEETANFVSVTLVCVAVLSMVALGIAVVALIGNRGCEHIVKSTESR